MNAQRECISVDSESSKLSRSNYRTPLEWKEIWLSKFDRTVAKEGLDDHKRFIMRQIIGYFLDKNHSPYYVKANNLNSFLENTGDIEIEALRYFYQKVAISEKHQELIEKNKCNISRSVENVRSENGVMNSKSGNSTNLQAENAKLSETIDNCRKTERIPEIDKKAGSPQRESFSSEERIALLNKLKLEINTRNYSQSTLSHYLGVVTRFMNRLTIESSRDWSLAFKEHLVWLRDDQKLAPNTINQYAASIAFFMEEVLEIEPGEDILIRMKTGKPLPRVHSLEKVAEIISAPVNFILRQEPELSNHIGSF